MYKILLALASMFFASVQAKEEVIWTVGERLKIGKPMYAHSNKCKLMIQDDGNFIVSRKVGDAYKVAWNTGIKGTIGDYFVTFQNDSQLVTYKVIDPKDEKKNVAVWGSGFTDKIGVNNFVQTVKIDSLCRLYIEPSDGDDFGWYSTWTTMAAAFGYLNQRNMYYDTTSDPPLTMLLQDDCNLVIFQGRDLADKGKVVWASKTANANLKFCYAFSDTDSFTLHEGKNEVYGSQDYDADMGKVLWQIKKTSFDYVALKSTGPVLK